MKKTPLRSRPRQSRTTRMIFSCTPAFRMLLERCFFNPDTVADSMLERLLCDVAFLLSGKNGIAKSLGLEPEPGRYGFSKENELPYLGRVCAVAGCLRVPARYLLKGARRE